MGILFSQTLVIKWHKSSLSPTENNKPAFPLSKISLAASGASLAILRVLHNAPSIKTTLNPSLGDDNILPVAYLIYPKGLSKIPVK